MTPSKTLSIDYGGTLATGPTLLSRRARPIDPDAIQTLWDLAPQHPLVLSTNTQPGCSRQAELEAARVDGLFRAVVESHKLGYEKPDRRFYAAVTQAADCDPSEIIHIGNHLLKDVLAPLDLGWNAVLVVPASVRIPQAEATRLDDFARQGRFTRIERFAHLPSVLEGLQ